MGYPLFAQAADPVVFAEDYHKEEAEEQAAASLRALARDIAIQCGVSSPRALLSAVQAMGAPEEVALGTPWHTTLMCSVVAAVASPCHLALQAPDEVALGTPWRMAVAFGDPMAYGAGRGFSMPPGASSFGGGGRGRASSSAAPVEDVDDDDDIEDEDENAPDGKVNHSCLLLLFFCATRLQ